MDQLIIIALYPNQNEITQALFESVGASECQKMDIRLGSTATNYKTATITLSGSWHQLTRFKTRFSLIQENYPITAMMQEAQTTTYPTESLSYQAYITACARSQTVSHIIQFFLSLPIFLHTVSIGTYQAPLTHTNMLDIQLTFITWPGKLISDYRESILQFCDENNFEVILESKRN